MALVKWVFVSLLLLHGLIHSLGFIKAFNIVDVSQLSKPVSKGMGFLWLLGTVLFAYSFALYVSDKQWWLAAIVAILVSQILIISSWTDARWGTLANVIILIASVIGYASFSFEQRYHQDVTKVRNANTPISDTLLTEADIASLPMPVQRYLLVTGCLGKPRVNSFYVAFEGQIRKNETSPWIPFTSEQYNFINNPARMFFMNAEMMHLPVAGYHRYKDIKAFMDIRLLSLFKVQYQDGPDMDTAETVTFFNDMCCMAPATLIDKRINWLETYDNHVRASFTNGGITVTATLYFNEKGLLSNFKSDDRYAAAEDGHMLRIPWSTPLSDYVSINGYYVPSAAEAIYHYPSGDLCYGTFKLADIAYNGL